MLAKVIVNAELAWQLQGVRRGLIWSRKNIMTWNLILAKMLLLRSEKNMLRILKQSW